MYRFYTLLLDFFKQALSPIPPKKYQPSDEFVKRTIAELARGNISMSAGNILTKAKQDLMYKKIKDFDFTKGHKV